VIRRTFLNVAVATRNMSTAAVSARWFCKKLRQVVEGRLGHVAVLATDCRAANVPVGVTAGASITTPEDATLV
jgi:hypothetical protein